MKHLRYLFFLILMFTANLNCGSFAINLNSADSIPKLILPKIKVDYSKFNLNEIKRDYGKLIKAISKNSNLTLNTIYSFLIVENQFFDTTAVSCKNAIGLMQVKEGTANDVVIMAAHKNMLSKLDESILISVIGKKRLNDLKTAPCLGYNHSITEQELTNPKLNLVVGCLYLKILSKESNNNIQKMGIRYLHGYFAFNSGKSITKKLLKNSDYVVKLKSIHKQITYYA